MERGCYVHRNRSNATEAQLKYWDSKKGVVLKYFGAKKGIHPIGEFKKGQPKPKNAYRWGQNENHPLWTGDFGSYDAMHSWVRRHKGRANHCADCGTLTAKKYEWSNIDHKYRRVLEDYVSRCTRCHHKYDYRYN